MYETGNSITAQSLREQSDYRAWEIERYSEENVISGEEREEEERVRRSCTFSRKGEHESFFNFIWSFI